MDSTRKGNCPITRAIAFSRGIPDGREVIILNPRVARISHGEAVYHFCVAKISLAERRIKLVIRRCDFYLVSPRKKICENCVKTLDFVIIKYYNLCILHKEKANQ